MIGLVHSHVVFILSIDFFKNLNLQGLSFDVPLDSNFEVSLMTKFLTVKTLLSTLHFVIVHCTMLTSVLIIEAHMTIFGIQQSFQVNVLRQPLLLSIT